MLGACQAQNLRRLSRRISPAAAQPLDMVARLFAIEADIKGRSPSERIDARRERANPILDELRAFLDATLATIGGKSDFAKAIRSRPPVGQP